MEYPQFGLSGRVALVTGAARGLGRAISLALANAGADVALGLRDVHADSGLAAEIRKMERKDGADFSRRGRNCERVRSNRHPGEQCWYRPRKSGRECT